MAEGHVPSEWKSARVIPLLKSGEPDNMENYRPISILPLTSKIMEKAVLYSFLTNNQLLNPYEFGFRKGHSTETVVIGLTDTIRWNMDHARLTGAVLIDLSKAFNTVDHSKLLSKPCVYMAITETERLWFTNYNADRRQLVQYRNVSSDYSVILSGAPQGSILGIVSRCIVLMYADDTVLYFASNSVSEIENVLNCDLHLLQMWLLDNILFLIKKTTEFVLFGTSARLSRVGDCTVNIGDHLVKRVLNFKYLGVVLDDALSWNCHLNSIFTNACKRIGMLGRIRQDITLNAANVIYKSFIFPIFYYCDSAWTCCNKCDAVMLERLQRRAAIALSSK